MTTRTEPDQAVRPRMTIERAAKSALFRKARVITLKLFWIAVCWFAVSAALQMAGVKLSNPAVFLGTIVAGVVGGLWLTSGKKAAE